MTTAYVNFHSSVNPLSVQHLMNTCGNIVAQGHDELYICLSTAGGHVMSGITMYNFLLSLPIKLTIHNMGNIDSIGNAIFLAGSQRRACKHSTFMFHGVGVDVGGHTRIELKGIREMLDSILADQQRITDILVERTRITPKQAAMLFAEARTKNANEALENGIVHEICDVTIPVGAPIFTLIIN